jgi:hypothetical protein
MGLVGLLMEGTDGGRLLGLVNEPTVDAALDAIDQALEQVLIAATERGQCWQLNQASLVVGRVHRGAGRRSAVTVRDRPCSSRGHAVAWPGATDRRPVAAPLTPAKVMAA